MGRIGSSEMKYPVLKRRRMGQRVGDRRHVQWDDNLRQAGVKGDEGS